MNRLLPTVAIACLLVSACAPNRGGSTLGNGSLITGAGGNVIAAGGGNVVSAGGGNLSASGTPQASGKPGASATAQGIPTTVRLALPAALSPSGVVAAGGANYRVQDAPPPDELARGLREQTAVYTNTTEVIDGILKGVAQIRLQPGKSVTFPDPGQKGRTLTVLMEVKPGHGVISVGTGNAAKGPTQLIAIRYTSPRQGRAVMHFVDPTGGRIHLATDFDLDAHQASADAVFDSTTSTTGQREKVIGHWEFTQTPAAKKDAAAFAMAGSVHLHRPERPKEDGVMAFAANFLPNGSGAFIFGAQNEGTGDRFVFLPQDGVSYFSEPPAAHDFYMTAKGTDQPKEEASAAQQAIVPPDSAIYRPFPENPSTFDPADDARFAFPE